MPSARKTIRRIVIPRFESPRAEAEWFDNHRRDLSADMRQRFLSGEGKTLVQALAQSAAKEKTKLKPVGRLEVRERQIRERKDRLPGEAAR